jgi:hypothetical protein
MRLDTTIYRAEEYTVVALVYNLMSARRCYSTNERQSQVEESQDSTLDTVSWLVPLRLFHFWHVIDASKIIELTHPSFKTSNSTERERANIVVDFRHAFVIITIRKRIE